MLSPLRSARQMNRKPTLRAWVMVTPHGPRPVHAPVHPPKRESVRGTAVSVTGVPELYMAEQLPGQEMPAGTLAMDPTPVPALAVRVSVNRVTMVHGLGVQDMPAPHVPVQAGCVVMVQVVATQQVAMGCGQGLGEQVVTGPQMPAHAPWVVSVQAPSMQHARRGWTQGLGLQIPPTVQVSVHWTWRVTLHWPLRLQQVPVGWSHGLGEQVPKNVQVPTQPTWSVTVHAPEVAQHSPTGCGQGLLGPQVVPAPRKLPPHPAAVLRKQLPMLVQQAPEGWGQGLGEQRVASP